MPQMLTRAKNLNVDRQYASAVAEILRRLHQMRYQKIQAARLRMTIKIFFV
jgi:hypothetical protein